LKNFSQEEYFSSCYQEIRVQKNPGFKKAQPTGFFRFYWVLGFIGIFGFFYLNEQFGSLLADLAIS